MAQFTAYITSSAGIPQRIDILADDIAHARQLAREHGAALYRCFTYSVRPA